MNAVKLAAKIAQYKYIFNPDTNAMPAVVTPARIPKVKAYFILSVFQAFKNKNNARNKKKNIADSFSGIPATVLDNKIGITIIKKVEIKEIMFARILLNFDSFAKSSLTKKKKTIIVSANIITGNSAAPNSTFADG